MIYGLYGITTDSEIAVRSLNFAFPKVNPLGLIRINMNSPAFASLMKLI